jgi:GT2 family glycosyltransferase
VGLVAIGRNEGERLRRCLDALPAGIRHVVYVDSASTDDSVGQARRRGIEVVELDMSIPFTAARARNAGIRRLKERWPDLRFAQVIDGDCVLVPGWLDAAVAEMSSSPSLAMVCGRRREMHREDSIYNRLCDMEWDAPLGDTESCGGDALVRLAAFLEVGGYDERVIAGEEPELCARLRARDWRIRRIGREMTLHDAAMTCFAQWWKRGLRSGHGFAQVGAMHAAVFRRQRRSGVGWGLLLPAAALLSAPITGGLGLVLLLAYPALWLRILVRRRARGDAIDDAVLYATFCVLGKFPEAAGIARAWWDRIRRRRSRLVEYK